MTRGLPWLAAGVTVGTVPYVVLKISWLVGGGVGLRDPALMQTTTYVVANSITVVLDLVVVALAWVLALAPPRRLLVVLAPLVWGATGLMVTPVLSAAVIAVAGDPSTERLAGDALYAWVYAVVYVGFAIQGVGIVTLFGVQVVRAWPWLFARRSARISPILVGGASAGALTGLGFLLRRAESNGSGSVPPCLRMRSEAPGWSRGCCAWQGRWGQWRRYAASACSQSRAPGSGLGRWSAGVDSTCSWQPSTQLSPRARRCRSLPSQA
jgi:hypothetical protein